MKVIKPTFISKKSQKVKKRLYSKTSIEISALNSDFMILHQWISILIISFQGIHLPPSTLRYHFEGNQWLERYKAIFNTSSQSQADLNRIIMALF